MNMCTTRSLGLSLGRREIVSATERRTRAKDLCGRSEKYHRRIPAGQRCRCQCQEAGLQQLEPRCCSDAGAQG